MWGVPGGESGAIEDQWSELKPVSQEEKLIATTSVSSDFSSSNDELFRYNRKINNFSLLSLELIHYFFFSLYLLFSIHLLLPL